MHLLDVGDREEHLGSCRGMRGTIEIGGGVVEQMWFSRVSHLKKALSGMEKCSPGC